MFDPWQAFPSGSVSILGLSEGIVFAEKEESAFLSKVKEVFTEARIGKEPVLVRVLVGSREGIEKWLRVSGPASCGLWVEVNPEKLIKQDGDELVTGELKVAYRLRSLSVRYLTVLSGTSVALLKRFEVGTTKSYIEADWRSALESKWLLLMPSKAFRQLLCMMEPGGVLLEFQIVLRQLVDSTNYLDVGFRYLDLSCWLAHYPFLLTLEGSDLLVVTRELRWTIMKFDCFDGKLKLTKGSALSDIPNGNGPSRREWELWEDISLEKDARRIGTLGAVVFNNFYVEGKGFIGGVAVQEFLDCLVGSWKEAGKKLRYMFCISGATVFELKSTNMFPSVRLSSEEQAALSKLQSQEMKERRQGLDILIEFLLGGMPGSAVENAGSTSFRGVLSSARDSAINWNTFHDTGSERLKISSKFTGSFNDQNPGWLRLLEWLDRGFFENLVEEVLLVSESGGQGVSRVTEALLKVIDVIPGDASNRIGSFVISHLNDFISDLLVSKGANIKRKLSSEQDNSCNLMDEKETEQRRYRQVEKSKKLVCMSNILSQIVQGSSIAAAVVADSTAIVTLEAFLDLVQAFVFWREGREGDSDGVLPGEIVDDKECISTVRPLIGGAPVTEKEGPVFSEFASSEISTILEAQRKEYLSYDQSKIRRTFQSSGFAKVLMKMILRTVGTVSTIKAFPENTRSTKTRTCLKTTNVFPHGKEYGALPQNVILVNARAACCHLLSACAIMLTNKSMLVTEVKQELVQKFKVNKRVQLVSCFVEELVHSSSDGFPEKLHEDIFEILYVLEKAEEGKSRDRSLSLPALMLSEVQRRMKAALSTWHLKEEEQMVSLGSLLQILSSFACKWPEKGTSVMVFECCGAEVERILCVLSSTNGPASWGGGELLVMQTLLRLFATSMQDCQKKLDDILWKTVIESNWDFIKGYSHWVVFDACRDCMWELLEQSLWSVWEPLELSDTDDILSSWLPRWLPSMRCEEIPLINLISFLRFAICLIQRKADTDKDVFMPGKARALLEFLMNPVTGLLMKLLKGDGLRKSKMIPQKEFEAAYFHLKHVREDLRSLIPFCTQRQGAFRVDHQTPSSRDSFGSLRNVDRVCVKNTSSSPKVKSMSYEISYLAATNLEIASLQLLASIFGLNFQRHMNFGPTRIEARNPFLSKSYAYPFLDFHFLRLIHLYYINLLQGRKTSGLEKVSENNCTMAWCAEAPCSEVEVRDEQLSLECAVHVQVLLALGQNQTDDLTLRFKQLRVMDFLVHQIALEYEASQIATPRDVVRINKALAAQLRNSAKNSEVSVDTSLVSTPSLAGLKKGLCMISSSTDLESAKRVCLGHSKQRSFQLLSKDIPKLELGFLSARSLGTSDRVGRPSCESYLLSRPFTGRQEFLRKWQEMMKPVVDNEHLKDEEYKLATEEQEHSVEEEKEDSSAETDSKAQEKAVYSGKFFDLNEEVERELAEEEESQSESSDDGSGSESGEETGTSVDGESERDAAFRPFVPKLNLPRSARKGEQETGSTAAPVQVDIPKDDNNKSPGIPSNCGSGKRLDPSTPYELERSQRRLYRKPSLHLSLLELYVTLMLTPQGTLDQRYSDRFQTEKQKLNAPFFLFYHLNHVANSYLLPCLCERMKAYHHSAFRILKLSWKGLFNPSLYKNRMRIAHGAFAQIYKATFNSEDGPRLIVLKTVDLPKGPYEPCKFFDVYSEVQILEKFTGEPRVCQILDYGVESDTFVLVLKHYKCSLRAWRLNHGKEGVHLQTSQRSFFERLPLYLEVYSAVLDAVKALEMHNVVHYDLKCDNVLLEPVDALVSEEEFWDPTWPRPENSYHLPFRVCLADFGQSKASVFQGGECTFRNRGTEYVKSPEMLKLLRTGPEYTVDASVGKAVDVWGLGCLLYELLAGEYLLYDEDWMRFFMRVTTHSEELITDEKAEKVGNYGPVVEFIRFVLVRDPSARPTLDEVMVHLKLLQESLGKTTKNRRDIELGLPNTEDNMPLEAETPKIVKRGLASWLCCQCCGD